VFQRPEQKYLLVELERQDRPLFLKDGQQSNELSHALKQTHDWLEYLGENVRLVRDELPGIGPRVPCLIVMGRSTDLTEAGRRERAQIILSTPGLEIMTYDELLAAAHVRAERMVGPLWVTTGNVQVYYLPKRPSGGSG
jgi:hypothetical protein